MEDSELIDMLLKKRSQPDIKLPNYQYDYTKGKYFKNENKYKRDDSHPEDPLSYYPIFYDALHPFHHYYYIANTISIIAVPMTISKYFISFIGNHNQLHTIAFDRTTLLSRIQSIYTHEVLICPTKFKFAKIKEICIFLERGSRYSIYTIQQFGSWNYLVTHYNYMLGISGVQWAFTSYHQEVVNSVIKGKLLMYNRQNHSTIDGTNCVYCDCKNHYFIFKGSKHFKLYRTEEAILTYVGRFRQLKVASDYYIIKLGVEHIIFSQRSDYTVSVNLVGIKSGEEYLIYSPRTPKFNAELKLMPIPMLNAFMFEKVDGSKSLYCINEKETIDNILPSSGIGEHKCFLLQPYLELYDSFDDIKRENNYLCSHD